MDTMKKKIADAYVVIYYMFLFVFLQFEKNGIRDYDRQRDDASTDLHEIWWDYYLGGYLQIINFGCR